MQATHGARRPIESSSGAEIARLGRDLRGQLICSVLHTACGIFAQTGMASRLASDDDFGEFDGFSRRAVGDNLYTSSNYCPGVEPYLVTHLVHALAQHLDPLLIDVELLATPLGPVLGLLFDERTLSLQIICKEF